MHAWQRRGITQREIIVLGVCIAVLLALWSVMVSSRSYGRAQARRLKDVTQQSLVHRSWLTFSNDFQTSFPTPGLYKRLPDPVLGETPGRGAEDISQNTTANLFSMCIMQNYFNPETCVGPTEPSEHVKVHENFNWTTYKPGNSVFWDPTFTADLHGVSNVSYAHQPLYGSEFKLKQWRSSMNSARAVLGNRGPLNGIHDPKSITNRIHAPNDSWNGFIIFNDNHSEMLNTFYLRNDNLFANDGDQGDDAWVTFTKSMSETGPVVEHD